MFNTFPTQTSSAGDESTFLSASAPSLPASALQSYREVESAQNLEGYASSVGSTIVLPDDDNTALTCLDASGSSLWSFAAPTNALATYDRWYGFYMNDDATLLHAVLVEESTNPKTFALVTINVSGTVATLGTDQPSSNFTDLNDFWTTNSTMQPEGTGFKLFNGFDTTTAQFAVIDATGQFTTDPTALYTNAVNGLTAIGQPYQSSDGYLVANSRWSFGSSSAVSVDIHNGTSFIQTALPQENLRGSTSSANATGYIRWRNYVVLWGRPSTGNRTAAVKYTTAAFDKFAKQLAAYVGIE